MTLSFLESFDAPPAPCAPEPRLIPEAEHDAARQEAQEQGYRAGWEAAMAAAAEDRARIGTELAASLQDLSFTYHEARAHVMRGVEPLLRELLESFLPAMMVEALGRTILQEVLPLAEEAADIPIKVGVAPQNADRLRAILGEETPVPLRIVEDAALGDGQAHLRLGESERLVDLAGLLCRITGALGAVSERNERTLAHA